jgi:hypothetical protein
VTPLTTPHIEDNRGEKGSRYYQHGHMYRERSCSPDEDLNTHGVQNKSRSQHRSSGRRQRSEERQTRANIDSGGGFMQAKLSGIGPRKLPRERSGILNVNADDISNGMVLTKQLVAKGLRGVEYGLHEI